MRLFDVVQVYLASILISAALMAQIYVRPFEEPLMNKLETLGLVCTFITQMGSILYWRFESLSTAVTVLLIAVNLITITLFGFSLVRLAAYSACCQSMAPCSSSS